MIFIILKTYQRDVLVFQVPGRWDTAVQTAADTEHRGEGKRWKPNPKR